MTTEATPLKFTRETLERDLGVPVVHPVTARIWEFQKWLHVREPRDGFGVMLRELP